jgi:hypothetical protein
MIKAENPIPEGLKRETRMNSIVIGRGWRTGQLGFLLIFTIAWDSFLVFWYATAFSQKEIVWLSVVFPIGHIAVGIGLTYYCIASLFNVTELEISPQAVRVTTKPVPWHKEMVYAPADIRDVVWHERGSRGYSTTFDVSVVTAANEEKRLIKSLPRYEQARFYVRELKSLLGLPLVTDEKADAREGR